VTFQQLKPPYRPADRGAPPGSSQSRLGLASVDKPVMLGQDTPAREQITLRSVLVGLFVGTLMCLSNMYFGLQTGWVTMGSLQSAILGYGCFKVMQQFGIGKGFTMAENVIVQVRIRACVACVK
jgi:uncharacterized oligopeptide transporter (OPT) family protein